MGMAAQKLDEYRIRPAFADDIDDLVAMGLDFAGSITHQIPVDEADLTDTLFALINGEDSLLLVAERGGICEAMLAGCIYPSYMNKRFRIAQELFFWVDPNARGGDLAGALLGSFEAWARGKNAHHVMMLSIEPLRVDAVGRFYRRLGYRPSEHIYMKRVGRWQ